MESVAPVLGEFVATSVWRKVRDIAEHPPAVGKAEHKLPAILKMRCKNCFGVPSSCGVYSAEFQPRDPRDKVEGVDGDVVESSTVQARFEIPVWSFPLEQRVLTGDIHCLNLADLSRADYFA